MTVLRLAAGSADGMPAGWSAGSGGAAFIRSAVTVFCAAKLSASVTSTAPRSEASRWPTATPIPYSRPRAAISTPHRTSVSTDPWRHQVGALVARMDLEQGSITERLEELGIVFADAEHVIDAVPASAEDARLLGVSPRVPMLRERRLTTDPAGVPVEWSDDRYLGRAVAFSVHNSVAVNALSRTPARSGSRQRL